MNKHNYTVPALTLEEVTTARTAIKSSVRQWVQWRHQGSHWRVMIKDVIRAYRKLQQTEVAP